MEQPGGLRGGRAAAPAGREPAGCSLAGRLVHLVGAGRAEQRGGGSAGGLRPARVLAGEQRGAEPERGAAGAAMGADSAAGAPPPAPAAGPAAGPAAARAALPAALRLPGSLPVRGCGGGQRPHGTGDHAAGAVGLLRAAGGRQDPPGRPRGAAGGCAAQPGVEGGGAAEEAAALWGGAGACGGVRGAGGGPACVCVCVHVCVRAPPHISAPHQRPTSVPSLTPHPSPEPADTKVPGGSQPWYLPPRRGMRAVCLVCSCGMVWPPNKAFDCSPRCVAGKAPGSGGLGGHRGHLGGGNRMCHLFAEGEVNGAHVWF